MFFKHEDDKQKFVVSYHDNAYIFLVVNTELLFNRLNSHDNL